MNKKVDFIIGGERRSGSTTLYHVIKQHPGVGMYPYADMDFFIGKPLFSKKDNKGAHDKDWEHQYNIQDYFNKFLGLSGVIGQKDADLLWWKNSHERLAKYLPETKFIFVLRNPVKRAESQYWNEVGKGRERRTFQEAIRLEEQGSLSPWEQLHLQYVKRGCYAESLQHFFNYIPKDRVLVVILENLFSDWENEMKQICSFLNIDFARLPPMQKTHTNKEDVPILNPKIKFFWPAVRIYDRIVNFIIRRITSDKILKNKLQDRFLRIGKISARTLNPIPNETLQKLKVFYRPYNQQLENLTGLNCSKWDFQQ